MKKVDDMTRDELRLAIAEKCGWKDIHPSDPQPGLLTYPRFVLFGKPPDCSAGCQSHIVPDYPRSWEAAGELLDQLPNGKNDACKPVVERWTGMRGWCCSIWVTRDANVASQGDTAPEAICRAWLKYMEQEHGA